MLRPHEPTAHLHPITPGNVKNVPKSNFIKLYSAAGISEEASVLHPNVVYHAGLQDLLATVYIL